VFGVSGSGKTRHCLDGLCHNWGLFISCRGREPEENYGACGSDDFGAAAHILPAVDGWNPHGENMSENSNIADRIFAMLLLARVYVLSQFLKAVPDSESVDNVRRRWVLLQAMPASANGGNDIFTALFRSLRWSTPDVVTDLVKRLIWQCKETRFFSCGQDTVFFLVTDEAQKALTHHSRAFLSSDGTTRRPLLNAYYRVCHSSQLFQGFIFVGTGLSMKGIEQTTISISGRKTRVNLQPRIFADIPFFSIPGNGDDLDHDKYIKQYLSLSDTISDRRLLERIKRWFPGRHVYSLLCHFQCMAHEIKF
jgi:hypothetical protein